MEASNVFSALECYVSEGADEREYEGRTCALSQLIAQHGGIVHSLFTDDVSIVVGTPEEYSMLRRRCNEDDSISFISPDWIVDCLQCNTILPYVASHFRHHS